MILYSRFYVLFLLGVVVVFIIVSECYWIVCYVSDWDDCPRQSASGRDGGSSEKYAIIFATNAI